VGWAEDFLAKNQKRGGELERKRLATKIHGGGKGKTSVCDKHLAGVGFGRSSELCSEGNVYKGLGANVV